MTLPAIDKTTPFANWWSRTFPGTACPALPTKESDLSLTALMALKADNPKLAQLLFANSSAPMPADTVVRRQNGQLQQSDIPHLRSAGLEWEAQELERKAEIAQSQRMAQQADESRRIAEAQMAYAKQYGEMSLMDRLAHGGPLPQEVVIQNRQRWRVTGK